MQTSIKFIRAALEAILPLGQARAARTSTVLIVDDEPLIVQGLAAILDREGFTVLTAFDAHSALKLVQKTSPELLISDVNMPGMDGIELAMRLVTAVPSMKVLLFSADPENRKVNFKPLDPKQFSVLAKPIPPQQMLDRVRASLGNTGYDKAATPLDPKSDSETVVIANRRRKLSGDSLPAASERSSSAVEPTPDIQMLPLDARLNARRLFLRIKAKQEDAKAPSRTSLSRRHRARTAKP